VGRHSWDAQRQILAGVASAVNGEERPLIVLGDFNTTPQAENFDLLANRLTDVHQAAGRGFGFTFPEPAALAALPWYLQPARLLAPVVRIDHILVNDRFMPLESYVVPAGYGSDHRPVVATVRFVDR
jgi:vancomycin resistance protein VanJ